MPIFEYADREPISPKRLLGIIDAEVEEYLRIEVENSDGTRSHNKTEAELLRLVFSTRRSFSGVLYEHVTTVDWSSEQPLPPDVFAETCRILTYFSDEYFLIHSDRLNGAASFSETTPCALAGRELLQCEEILQSHMYVLSGFGYWLRRKYIHESQTPDERETDANVEIWMQIQSMFHGIVAILAEGYDESPSSKLMLHGLIDFMHSDFRDPAVRKWVDAMEEWLDQLGDTAPFADMQKEVERIFRTHFPQFWRERLGHEIAKIITIGSADDRRVMVLPVDHLYFQPTIGECSGDDRLPMEGDMSPDPVFRDISLFNNLGEKVYWGDLSAEEIKEVRGPYYLLNQNDSYHSVPAYAIQPESTVIATDVNRPKGMPDHYFAPDKRLLRLSYIKSVAQGVIESGQFTQNSTKIFRAREEEK